MARGHKREVRTQVVWEDLRAWVEQLWGTHGVQVEVLIRLVPSKAGIASAVIVNFIRAHPKTCLLYTSPSPRDGLLSRMPSSA